MVERQRTVPDTPPPRAAVDDEPTILGFPAEVESDDEVDAGADPVVRLVVLRRSDRIAGAALVLAGLAAAASLALPWVRGERDLGCRWSGGESTPSTPGWAISSVRGSGSRSRSSSAAGSCSSWGCCCSCRRTPTGCSGCSRWPPR